GGLHTRCGVRSAQGRLAQVAVLINGDISLPDVQVRDVEGPGHARRRVRRVRRIVQRLVEEGLALVQDRPGADETADVVVTDEGCGGAQVAEALREDPVDVGAAGTDAELARSGHADREARRGHHRHSRLADLVVCRGAVPPVRDVGELVEVGVEAHPPLLLADGAEQLDRVEGRSRVVAAHAVSLASLQRLAHVTYTIPASSPSGRYSPSRMRRLHYRCGGFGAANAPIPQPSSA